MAESGFGTLVAGLGLAAKVLQTLKDLVKGRDAQAQVSQLYDIILGAQQSAMEANLKEAALVHTVRELEEQLARIKAWNATKERYQLKELSPGIFAYALKEAAGGDEPAHWICQKCYEDGVASIIQLARQSDYSTRYRCPRCGFEFGIPTGKTPPSVGGARTIY